MPLIVTPQTIKHLQISLTIHIQDLYTENYKVLMKNIKGDLNKDKTYHIHGMGESTQ